MIYIVVGGLIGFYVRDEPLICSILWYVNIIRLLYIFESWPGFGEVCGDRASYIVSLVVGFEGSGVFSFEEKL